MAASGYSAGHDDRMPGVMVPLSLYRSAIPTHDAVRLPFKAGMGSGCVDLA
jgi:hypothetical protein